MASELYDPSVPLLARVLQGQPVFPAAAFATPDWLKVRLPQLLAAAAWVPDCGWRAASTCWPTGSRIWGLGSMM